MDKHNITKKQKNKALFSIECGKNDEVTNDTEINETSPHQATYDSNN